MRLLLVTSLLLGSSLGLPQQLNQEDNWWLTGDEATGSSAQPSHQTQPVAKEQAMPSGILGVLLNGGGADSSDGKIANSDDGYDTSGNSNVGISQNDGYDPNSNTNAGVSQGNDYNPNANTNAGVSQGNDYNPNNNANIGSAQDDGYGSSQSSANQNSPKDNSYPQDQPSNDGYDQPPADLKSDDEENFGDEFCSEDRTHVCVPYFLCREGSIVTDGGGIIDIRFGPSRNDNTSSKINSHSQCKNYLHVCCRDPDAIPITTTTVAPYRPACGRRNKYGLDVRIVGFKDSQAQFGEFPWMAAIVRTDVIQNEVVNIYVGGGSLIHESVVMTAAHALINKKGEYKFDPASMKVRLGEWDTQRTDQLYPHQDYNVAKVVVHSGFHPTSLHYDVALLFLERPAQLSPYVDTVCLPVPYMYQRSNNINWDLCTITGWGKDKFGEEGVYQSVLKSTDVPLWGHNQCQSALRTTRLWRRFKLHQSFTCAGGEAGKDACEGDRGAPLVCPNPDNPDQYIQMGIVAWGIDCGKPGIPGVYANVARLTPWIDCKLRNYFSQTGSIYGYNYQPGDDSCDYIDSHLDRLIAPEDNQEGGYDQGAVGAVEKEAGDYPTSDINVSEHQRKGEDDYSNQQTANVQGQYDNQGSAHTQGGQQQFGHSQQGSSNQGQYSDQQVSGNQHNSAQY